MKKISHLAVLTAVLFLSFGAGAGTIAATAADQPIVPGEWHQGISNAFAMAQVTGIPIVGLWANTGCSKCAAVIDQAVNTPAFTAWRQSRQLLMVTGEGKSGLAGELYDWTKAAAGSDGDPTYPFIRIYWVQKNGTVRVDTRFSGYPYRADAQTLINQIERYVADFRYTGYARFDCTPGLEAEPDTAAIPLPLVREYGAFGQLTNTVSFVRTLEAGGSTNWTETIVWSEGETSKTVTVVNEGHYVGGTVTLTLAAKDEIDQTAVIAMVAERPVTTVNPRFIGEPFAFGEWTMDFNAATSAVASAAEDAYTLVLFTGALWCPYCIGMERDWLSTPVFKDFVRTNNIALVEIDNYKRDGSAPTLLRYDVYTGATNDTRNGHSGAGYLSRHGISVDTAEAVLARNMALQAAWTLPGAARIGYPTLILLRKDGSIAGRFSGSYRLTDNTVVPGIQSFDLGVNMQRLNELLSLARDPRERGEEANGYAAKTADVLEANDTRTASLRATDLKDLYVLRTAAGLRQEVAVCGPLDATVQVALMNAAGQTVQAQTGSLTNGVFVTADMTGSGVVYAAVQASGAAVAASSVKTTVRPYAIVTRYSLAVSEAAQVLEVMPFAESGTWNVTLLAESNAVYRFVAGGATLAFPNGGFEPMGGDLFRAVTGVEAEIRLTEVSAGDTFTWQLWNPGTVGFVQAAASVAETVTNHVIEVQRTGGVSGACSVTVTLDAANTTAEAGEDFTDVFGAGVVLTWADGEVGTKTIELPLQDDRGYEGDEVVALTLAITGGATTLAAQGAAYRLTLVEDDQPIVGRLGFGGGNTVFVKTSPLTVVAPEGGSVALGVERVEGASTAISAQVAATAGTIDPGTLAWTDNDREQTKETHVTLPMLAEVPHGVVSVTLKPDGTVKTVPGKEAVYVQLIAADAPVFADGIVSFAGQTRVVFGRAVQVLQTAGGKVGIEKRTGSLPAGIVANYDRTAACLTFTGVPRTAGTFTAVYQVWEIRGRKKVMGGVVQVMITVAELETLNAAAVKPFSAAEGAVIDLSAGRVIGTLTVSMTRTGRLSAKYLHKKGTTRFSGSSWTFCDAEGKVTFWTGTTGYQLAVQMSTAGELKASILDTNYGTPLMAHLTVPAWSESNPATDYVGYYTASLSSAMATGAMAPSGYSYMTLLVRSSAARTGKVTYAGKLADGTSYSGSTVLQPFTNEQAQIIIFAKKSKYVLAGLLSLDANAVATYKTYPSALSACGGVEPYWTFDSGYPETSYDVTLDICGGYYNSADSLEDYYNLYEGAGPMGLMAEGADPESVAYGSAEALSFVALAVSDSSLRIARETVNPAKARLSLAKATGLFRGSYRIPFVNASTETRTVTAEYAGVLLPGWTGDCGCGDGEVELPEKPFGMGAYWFTDRMPVAVGADIRVKSAKRGYPIIIRKSAE